MRFALFFAAAGSLYGQQVFAFQNSFWVNLHHFVRGEARRQSTGAALELPLAELTASERVDWQRALDRYQDLAKRTLFNDPVLVKLNNALATTADAAAEPELRAAAPIYRAHRWERHRGDNEAWIAAHVPDIQRRAAEVRKAIADAFGVPAPTEPILVDLARDIGPNLAYTSNGPAGYSGHTVIAPQKNADYAIALDTMYHEISHTMDRLINEKLYGEAERQHVTPPDNLWHALTVFTTWKITRRGLSSASASVVDTDERTRFASNHWHELLIVLEKDWQPHLEGKIPLDSALRDLVRETAH